MNTDLIKKLNYMINMESGANFEYLSAVSEKSGHAQESTAHLQKAQEKYYVAQENAVTEKEVEDSKRAVKRVMDRIVASRPNVR